MTALLRDWILGIVAISLLSSFALSLAGDAPARRVIRLISAFALLLAVILPLKGVDVEMLRTSFSAYTRAYEREVENTAVLSNEFLCDLTGESLAEYVVSLASARDISCTAQVETALYDGYALPVSCTVTIETEIEQSDIEALREEIASALHIDQVSIVRR